MLKCIKKNYNKHHKKSIIEHDLSPLPKEVKCIDRISRNWNETKIYFFLHSILRRYEKANKTIESYKFYATLKIRQSSFWCLMSF